MAKDSNPKCNSLKINVLPPHIDGDKENDFTYSRHLSKLLWRFVRLAVPDPEQVTFSDRELLDDLLRYGSLNRIAKLRHVSVSTLSCRLQDVISCLDKSVERWEQIAQSDQTARISQLEQELSTANSANALLQEKVSKLAAYNRKQAVAQAREAYLSKQQRIKNSHGGRIHNPWA